MKYFLKKYRLYMQCIYGAWCIIYMNEHLAVKQLICKIPGNFTYQTLYLVIYLLTSQKILEINQLL